MIRWAAWLWALTGFLLFFAAASAQVSSRLQGCSPYSQPANGPSNNAPRPPRIVFDDIRFDPPALPDEIKAQLTEVIKQKSTRAWPGGIDDVGEILVRGTLQDEGYYRVESKAEAETRSTDAELQHVSVNLHIDLGLQYRLGSVNFRSADPTQPLVFPIDELRRTISLSEGDLFNATRIREGLDTLKRLYGSRGYIDFVAAPLTVADDATQRISLIMQLYQQKQFHIGKVKVISPDPKLQTLLESEFKPGDIFNSQALADFFEANKSILPPNASPEDMEVVRRDVKAGIADLNFNLLACSQFRSTLDPRSYGDT